MKKKIAVLFGGCSPEYSVSLQSAHAVLTHMDPGKYEPVAVGISPAGDWFLYTGPWDRIPADTWLNDDSCIPAAVSPNRSDRALLLFHDGGVEKRSIDAAFPVLHGRNGEDGTVQGLLELAAIPTVGCGTLSSALCMDKARAHALAALAGVAVPASFVLERNHDRRAVPDRAKTLGFPLYVKPLRAGSSYGISRVSRPEELTAALDLAFSYDSRIVVEQNVPGFEVGCAVLGNDVLTVGAPDEIELSGGFFDFEEKYTLKTSSIHCPARITPAQVQAVQEAALTVYRALDCRGFARVDLFLTPEGKLVFNEVNTIPGFTAHSRYPKMMAAAGLPFPALVDRLIELGVQA